MRPNKETNDILRAKELLMEKANRKLLESITSVELLIFKAIDKILGGFSTKGGRFIQDDDNSTLLSRITRSVRAIIKQIELDRKVGDYIANFDEIENLNRSLYGQLLGINDPRVNVSVFKKMVIEDVSNSILLQSSLNRQYIYPIRRMIFNAVVMNQDVTTAKKNLELFIKGDGQKLGRLRAYTGQIAQDAISGFDGFIQDRYREEYEMDGFMYVGSLVDDSRPNCVGIVSGSGGFGALALRGGMYKVEDIPKIIEIARGGKGFNPLVTPQTFAQYRMGYNCRHQVIYIRLLDEDLEQNG